MGALSRLTRRRARRVLPCCKSSKFSDTGRYSRGLHTHAPRPKAHDHATGTGFVKDRSTTKAVLWRMEALGAW